MLSGRPSTLTAAVESRTKSRSQSRRVSLQRKKQNQMIDDVTPGVVQVSDMISMNSTGGAQQDGVPMTPEEDLTDHTNILW